jgi:hypothetical protein
MDRISITSLVDLLLETGSETDANAAKDRKADPLPEFYQLVRDAIVDMHRRDLPDNVLDKVLDREPNPKRERVLERVINGYRRFLGIGSMKWFEPPSASYVFGANEIDINPELGLAIDETPYVIKMYLRGEPLTPRRVQATLGLLAGKLGRSCPGHVFGLLEVRHGKLHALRTPEERMGAVQLVDSLNTDR